MQSSPLSAQLLKCKEVPLYRNTFIEEHKAFIIHTVTQVTKRYLDLHNDEEISIGLMAFNEAIDQYDSEKNDNFLAFAGLVIRRRVIDYIRYSLKTSHEISLSIFGDSETAIPRTIGVHSIDPFHSASSKEEILQLSSLLKGYGISFSDLIKHTPKHQKTRQLVFYLVNILLVHYELLEILLKKKQLPIKELLQHVSVSRITLERHRKYIIALTLIMYGEFESLQNYVKEVFDRE